MCNFKLSMPKRLIPNNSSHRTRPPQDYTESVEAIGRALKELKAKSKVPVMGGTSWQFQVPSRSLTVRPWKVTGPQ